MELTKLLMFLEGALTTGCLDGHVKSYMDRAQEEHAALETERDAWKEAFAATRAYYSNNNGENSTRYRAAVKQLKERKLIK